MNEIDQVLRNAGFREPYYKRADRMSVYTHDDGSLVRVKDFHEERYLQPGRKMTKELVDKPHQGSKTDKTLCKFTDDGRMVAFMSPRAHLVEWFRQNVRRSGPAEAEVEAAIEMWADESHIPIRR